LKKHTLELIATKKMTRQAWLAKRQEGLGGSDMGTIMGVNKYFSRLQLFHQKCGLILDIDSTNPAMFWGNALEPVVRDFAQYLDLETGKYMENYEAGNKIRAISEFKYMVRNPRYPWLLANIDGLEGLNKRSYRAEAIAELKTISRQSAEMWETIPPYHYFQVIMYHTVLQPMLTGDEDKIFYLKDGRDLYGFRIPFNRDVSKNLIEITEDFWGRVTEGKRIVKEMLMEGKSQDQIHHALIPLEPEAEVSDAYEDYLSTLYKMKSDPSYTMKGDEFLLDHARSYKYFSDELSATEKQRQASKIAILDALRKTGASAIEWEGNRSRVVFNKRFYVTVVD
jgi:putative phage-type endonuclease